MRCMLFISLVVTLMSLSGCSANTPTCPPATGTSRSLIVPPESLPKPAPDSTPTPVLIEIGGKTIPVDEVVEGPLCNDSWSGTVYVTCNVQVHPWEEQPTFLKNCNLSIAPGTVVYVAYHHDTAYYNGCSCHTGEITGP